MIHEKCQWTIENSKNVGVECVMNIRKTHTLRPHKGYPVSDALESLETFWPTDPI